MNMDAIENVILTITAEEDDDGVGIEICGTADVTTLVLVAQDLLAMVQQNMGPKSSVDSVLAISHAIAALRRISDHNLTIVSDNTFLLSDEQGASK